jgi:hypothetical protein
VRLLAGEGIDRLGYAFRDGYAAALRALIPSLGELEVVALCATEEAGAHPRAIQTRWDGERVTGRKLFVTMGTRADRLLVVAREDGGNLRVVSVDARAPGVHLLPMPPTAFAPEIPHAEVRLEAAPGVALPGDGYSDYLKPFRTIEDIHVYAATVGYLMALGRRVGWKPLHIARLAALGASLAHLAELEPLAPATHLALGGALDLGRQLFAGLDLDAVPEEERARWLRDRPLLEVAGKARAQRFETACRLLKLVPAVGG